MTTPIPKPAVGSTGWDVSVDAVIDRVNELGGIEDDIAAKLDTAGGDARYHQITGDVDVPAGQQVNVGGSPSTAPIAVQTAAVGNSMFTGYISGDTHARVLVDNNEISFGPGNAAVDVVLGRSGVGAMTVVGNLTVTGNVTAGNVMPTVVTLTDAATVALDASAGSYFRLTALGNRTILTPTNPTDGQAITIEHLASGGARTLTLTTGSAGAFDFGTTITALAATASGTRDLIRAIYNASLDRWMVVGYSQGF